MASDPRVTVHISVDPLRPYVTETTFWWRSASRHLPGGLRKAICAWAEQHGLDPNQMPMHAAITRDVERCRVECSYFELDDKGRRIWVMELDNSDGYAREVPHVAQGETPPMPWPAEILALVKETA